MQGDTDDESNFIQLLKLRGKDRPLLLKWLETKEDKYTSHEIQNEIIAIRLHSLCMLQGGGGGGGGGGGRGFFFFFSGSVFFYPPQGPYKFSEPPQTISRKMNYPPSPLTRNIKINICIIVRDMFNKNIERALTVYVIPMPASLSSAN